MQSRRRFLSNIAPFAALISSLHPSLSIASVESSLSSDVIVYGATPGGLVAALELVRQGRTVTVVGGWREWQVGGMMSGGLGGTDLAATSAWGGLSRDMFRRIYEAAGKTFNGSTWVFEPRHAKIAFESLIAEAGIPVHLSTGGIVDCTKDGARITSITTGDGRRYSAKVFIDASYEGDLLAQAGVSFVVGREQANSRNPLNGYRGLEAANASDNHQFRLLNTSYDVNPFRNYYQQSGLLPGLNFKGSLKIGDADNCIQSYNFRMVMTDDPRRKVDFPAEAPVGWDPINYELLFRFLDSLTNSGNVAGVHYGIRDFFIFNETGTPKVYDVNNKGGFSTDLIGGSYLYPTASYADRERLHKAHEGHIRGLFYALQHHQDSRVPRALRQEVRTFGLDIQHFVDHHPNDTAHWPTQLYVREARRMNSQFVLDQQDLTGSDGEPSRSMKTISTACYALDSHHVQRIADVGLWRARVWNEGNLEVPVGGTDLISPIPFDVSVPDQAECENLLVTFAISATHAAFGSFRMEGTHMQMGQSLGMAAAIAIEQRCPVQSVDYVMLRRRLLQTPEAIKPVLPQNY